MLAIARKQALIALIVIFLLSGVASAPSGYAAECSWMSKAPMLQPRDDLGVAVVNGKIYAMGIESGGSVEEYDTVTDTWVSKSPMPTPRSHFATAVYQNKIYCIGGAIGFSSEIGFVVKEENEVYDPATDTWETKKSMPTARANSQANIIDGKIYVIGGTEGLVPSNVTEVYDPVTDTWTTKASMPETYDSTHVYINKYASSVINNKIYMISSGLTQIYDPKNDNWSRGATPPSFTYVLSGGTTTGLSAPQRIYLFTADNTGTDWKSSPGFKIQSYDPTTDSWAASTYMPTGRFGFAVAVLEDKLYLIGGHTIVADKPPYLNQKIIPSNENVQYIPAGYGTILPTVAILSPLNTTYAISNVSLVFTVSKPVLWIGYSLDGEANITITSNITLTALAMGSHNLTIYAIDEFENGSSELIMFTISEPLLTAPVATVSGAATVAIAMICLFYHSKKNNKKQ